MGEISPQTNYPADAVITPSAASTGPTVTSVSNPLVIQPSKPWYMSVTLWVNLIGLFIYSMQDIVGLKIITDPVLMTKMMFVMNILMRIKTAVALTS